MHHEYIASGDSPKPLLFLITHRKWFHDGPWLWIYHCIDVVDWMFPCSHIHTMRSNPQCNGIWRLGLWDIISHKAKALMNGVSALIRGQAASSAIQSVVICYSSPNWVRQLMTSINFYFWTRPSPNSRLISNCIRWYFHLEPKEHFPHHQWFFPQFSPFVQIIPTQLFMPKKITKITLDPYSLTADPPVLSPGYIIKLSLLLPSSLDLHCHHPFQTHHLPLGQTEQIGLRRSTKLE